MASKSVNVLGKDGAGKKTLLGSLIYKCGLEMPQLEELECQGIHRMADIVLFYEKMGRTQSFEAPSGLFVAEKILTPDVVCWVADATDTDSWTSSAQELASSLSSSLSSSTLKPRDKVIILVNKMDLVNWSEQTFKEVVGVFDAANLNDRTYMIPISSFGGENLLSTPQEPLWVKNISSERFGGSRLVSGQPLMSLLGAKTDGMASS